MELQTLLKTFRLAKACPIRPLTTPDICFHAVTAIGNPLGPDFGRRWCLLLKPYRAPGETWSNTKPQTKPLALMEAHERKLQHFKLRYGPGLVPKRSETLRSHDTSRLGGVGGLIRADELHSTKHTRGKSKKPTNTGKLLDRGC